MKPKIDEILQALTPKSNAYSEKTGRHETKEYENNSMNMRFGGVNRDPVAFQEIHDRFTKAQAEIEANRGR